MTSTETPKPLPSALRQFFDSIKSTCLPLIDQATVPILGVQDDEIRHDRTGVLYRIGAHNFILTASHDLRQIIEYNIPLYVSLNSPGIEPLPLADARFHSTEVDGRDVAAIWLPPDLAQEIARHKQFLYHNQIDLHTGQRGAPYVLFGYPMHWSGRVIAENDVYSRALVFATIEHEGLLPTTDFHDPAIHIVLNFTVEGIDVANGKHDMLPEPKGISGCGVWQVGDRSENGLNARSAQTLSLVGVQHCWSQQRGYVRATRIGHVLDLITANYPETEIAMNVIYSKG